MEFWRTVQSNTLVSLPMTLKDAAGTAINITDMTVLFHMVDTATNTRKVDGGTITVIDAATGRVQYDWQDADVETPGTYYGYCVRTSGSKDAQHPLGRGLRIVIEPAP